MGNCTARPDDFDGGDLDPHHPAARRGQHEGGRKGRRQDAGAISTAAPSSTHAAASSTHGGTSCNDYSSDAAEPMILDLTTPSKQPFEEKQPPAVETRYTVNITTEKGLHAPDSRSRNVNRNNFTAKTDVRSANPQLTVQISELESSPVNRSPLQPGVGEFVGTSPVSGAHSNGAHSKKRVSPFPIESSSPRHSDADSSLDLAALSSQFKADPTNRSRNKQRTSLSSASSPTDSTSQLHSTRIASPRSQLLQPTFDTSFFIPEMVARQTPLTPAQILITQQAQVIQAQASSNSSMSGTTSHAPARSHVPMDRHHALSRNAPRGLMSTSPQPICIGLDEILATSLAPDRHERLAHRARGAEPRQLSQAGFKTQTSKRDVSENGGESTSGGGVQLALASSNSNSQRSSGEWSRTRSGSGEQARELSALHATLSEQLQHGNHSRKSPPGFVVDSGMLPPSRSRRSSASLRTSTLTGTGGTSDAPPLQRSPVLGSIQARKRKRDAEARKGQMEPVESELGIDPVSGQVVEVNIGAQSQPTTQNAAAPSAESSRVDSLVQSSPVVPLVVETKHDAPLPISSAEAV